MSNPDCPTLPIDTPELYSDYCCKGNACDACADDKNGDNCLNATHPPGWDAVVSFYLKSKCIDPADRNHTSYTLKEWNDNYMDGVDVPEWLVKYIDFDLIIRDQWNADEIAIIHHDVRYTLLEHIGDTYPLWKKREWEFFVGHPDKDSFIIIDLRAE